jgi:hypothetical protein
LERRVRPSGSDRRLCFARSAKASGLFVFLRERW